MAGGHGGPGRAGDRGGLFAHARRLLRRRRLRLRAALLGDAAVGLAGPLRGGLVAGHLAAAARRTAADGGAQLPAQYAPFGPEPGGLPPREYGRAPAGDAAG